MTSFKCPNCGASISEDSLFCKYCGNKIDDGVKRSEINVNIHKKIEDVGDIKWAELAEKEAARREAKEKRQNTLKWIKIGFWLVFYIVAFGIIMLTDNTHGLSGGALIGAFMLIVGSVYLFLTWIHKIAS